MATETTGNVYVEWMFLSDYAMVDPAGKVSIIGVFDRLFAQSFPSVHPVAFIVASYEGTPGQSVVAELRLWSPNKDLVLSAQQQLTFGPNGKSHGIMRLSPVPLPVAGDYLFELLVGATSLKHLPLSVEVPT